MDKTDGGPAFPNEAKEIAQIVRGEGEPMLITKAIDAQSGMSLRDAFASTAGDEAFRILDAVYGPEWSGWGTAAQTLADMKYQIADAMLEHRNKEGEPDD